MEKQNIENTNQDGSNNSGFETHQIGGFKKLLQEEEQGELKTKTEDESFKTQNIETQDSETQNERNEHFNKLLKESLNSKPKNSKFKLIGSIFVGFILILFIGFLINKPSTLEEYLVQIQEEQNHTTDNLFEITRKFDKYYSCKDDKCFSSFLDSEIKEKLNYQLLLKKEKMILEAINNENNLDVSSIKLSEEEIEIVKREVLNSNIDRVLTQEYVNLLKSS